MAYETLILFFITDLWFCLTPGPATIVCASHAIKGGMKNALGPIMGIHMGNFIWYALSAFGLVALIQSAPQLYNIIRWIGVIYLLWIGFNMLQQSGGKQSIDGLSVISIVDFKTGFISGLAVHMANPKALLFYAAFLPQFINPDISIGPQILILAAITIITESIGLFFYSSLAAGVGNLVNTQNIAIWINILAALCLILVAIIMSWYNFNHID